MDKYSLKFKQVPTVVVKMGFCNECVLKIIFFFWLCVLMKKHNYCDEKDGKY